MAEDPIEQGPAIPFALGGPPPPDWYDAQGQFALGGPPPLQVETPEGPLAGPMVGIPAPAPPPPPPPQKFGPGSGLPLQEVAAPIAPPDVPTGAPPQVPDFAHLGFAGNLPIPAAPPTAADVQVAKSAGEGVEFKPNEDKAFEELSPEEQQKRFAAMPPDEQQKVIDQRERGYEAMSPEDRARSDATREATRQRMFEQKQYELADQSARDAADNHAAFIAAQNDNRVARAQLDKEIQALGSKKPEGLGLAQSILGIAASAVGGFTSAYTGGPNLGLQGFESHINRQLQEQQQMITEKRAALGMRAQSLGEKMQQDNADYREAELFRATAYEQAIQHAQAEAQKYDPAGTTAQRVGSQIVELRARQQAALAAWQQQDLKTRTEIYKAQWEGAGKRATIQKELAGPHSTPTPISGQIYNPFTGALENYGGSGIAPSGGGLGGAGNTKYNVPTGIMSPILDEQGNPIPLMGTKSLDTKGHEKEFGDAVKHVQDYHQTQTGWKRLAEIGAKIDYHKNVLHDFDKTQATLVKEYENATHGLVVYLTKDLGDKLTQGQITEQSERIPALTKWLSQVDVGKIIKDSQEQSDEDFTGDMNALGVNARPLVAAEQKRRAPPPAPAVSDEIAAAQRAYGAAPEGSDEQKSAKVALDAAKGRLTQHIEERKQGKAVLEQETGAAKNVRLPDTLNTEGMPAKVQAEIEVHNDAVETMQRERDKLLKLEAEKPKPTGKVGEDRKAAGEYKEAVEHQAYAAHAAERARSKALNDSLRSALSHLDELPADKRKAIEDLAEKHKVSRHSTVLSGVFSSGGGADAMIRAATDEDGVPAFRYGLIKLLGAE